MRTLATMLLLGACALVLAPSCGGGADCVDGTCICADDASCDLPCDAPPCHVECGDGSTCNGACANGDCKCGLEAACDFTCDAPPCHVDCQGGNPSCKGECANGTCTCGPGSSCSFACEAPPCHVECAGNNPSCDGTCANGSCTCGPGSTCHFTCASGPCHATCAEGASCIVTCPNAGVAGTQDCDIPMCGAGMPTICADGLHVACGLPCP